MKTHCIRLVRGQDILEQIKRFCEQKDIKAGVILSSAGCLTAAGLRDAGGVIKHEINDEMEIISVNGTVSVNRCHLHISLSKKDLSVIGGHLMYGCKVNTTCELVVLEIDDIEFNSIYDESTGYNEIEINAI